MKMDRRLSNGLAWAGALLVIGIPAADFVAGALSGPAQPRVAVVDAEAEEPVAELEATPQTAAVAPVPVTRPANLEATEEVAATTPAKPVAETKPVEVASTAGNAVDSFVQSGKPLPSYINDGGAPQQAAPTVKPVTPAATATPTQTQAPTTAPATATAPVTTAPVQQPAEQVAALPPAQVAPVPMPLSMRPQPVSVPLVNTPVANAPLIIDQPTTGLPVQNAPVQQQQPNFVTADDLADWESGPLSDFLAQRNGQSSATYRVQQNQPAYDSDGFWLDEAPQADRPIRRFPSNDDVYYLPF